MMSKVDYEVDGDKIFVTEKATGAGMVFKMINKDTIHSKTMGAMGIMGINSYNRVK